MKAKQHKVNAIVVESNFGDGMFVELRRSWWTTYAEQIQLLPTPLKPSIIARLSPRCM
jgi:hypothetical protein